MKREAETRQAQFTQADNIWICIFRKYNLNANLSIIEQLFFPAKGKRRINDLGLGKLRTILQNSQEEQHNPQSWDLTWKMGGECGSSKLHEAADVVFQGVQKPIASQERLVY